MDPFKQFLADVQPLVSSHKLVQKGFLMAQRKNSFKDIIYQLGYDDHSNFKSFMTEFIVEHDVLNQHFTFTFSATTNDVIINSIATTKTAEDATNDDIKSTKNDLHRDTYKVTLTKTTDQCTTSSLLHDE